MDNITDKISDVAQVAKETKPIWQNLPRLLKGWGSPKGSEVIDRQEELRNLLRENARDTLASQELALDTALHILGPGFESEDVLDPTWQKRWLLGVGNVAVDDEERRTWWARLLAGEIQNPGTYSLRTLSIMDSLSPNEAQLFRKLCACVWLNAGDRPVLLMPNSLEGETWGMTEKQVQRLEEAGLVSMPPLGYRVDMAVAKPHRFKNGDIDLFVQPTNNLTWVSSTVAFTSSGEQIFNLVEVVYDADYVRDMVFELQRHAKICYATRTQNGWIAGKEINIPLGLS